MKKLNLILAIVFLLGLLVPGAALAAQKSEHTAMARAVHMTDRTAVENACRQMETAYQSLEPSAVAALYHDLSPRGVKLLETLFKRSSSVDVGMKFKEIHPGGREATVMMTSISLVEKRWGKTAEAYPNREYLLEKIGGEWKFTTK